MDKFGMVYEFNKESPLITYKASRELEAKNYSKAIQLLTTAIEKYPEHSTAYFLYAVALAHNDEFNKAYEILAQADKLWNERETYEFYLDQIENIKRVAQGISANFDDTVNDVLNESFLEPEDFGSDIDIELFGENLNENETEYKDDFEQTGIVTETLAEIYASQNNFEEALDIYEKLKKIKPEMEEKFESRIVDLNAAIESKKQKKFGN